jgi:hypothetical protein
MSDQKINKVKSMTFAQRSSFIDAGLDTVYCEHPDPTTESVAYMGFVRKQIAWINDNILGYDIETTPDYVIAAEATNILHATVVGEEETIKNS